MMRASGMRPPVHPTSVPAAGRLAEAAARHARPMRHAARRRSGSPSTWTWLGPHTAAPATLHIRTTVAPPSRMFEQGKSNKEPAPDAHQAHTTAPRRWKTLLCWRTLRGSRASHRQHQVLPGIVGLHRRRPNQLVETWTGQACLYAPTLTRVRKGHTEQHVGNIRCQCRGAPRASKLEQAMDTCESEELVSQACIPPRRTTSHHDKQANAGGENINRRDCVAENLCS
mmetsp:Transcript_96820/g.278570  ORF Transcript_96820/g.278570 Transcript_96820/m.278570 type:complete len:227 (+) Transcript_96820:311-991(+)